MAIITEPQQLLQLLAFMSPAFPVGGFAYSHGLERAIDDGTVTSADEVREWIESLLVHGSGWNDAVLFAQAYDADEAVRLEIDELALALAASRERALETSDLGQSFVKAAATMSLGKRSIIFKPIPSPWRQLAKWRELTSVRGCLPICRRFRII